MSSEYNGIKYYSDNDMSLGYYAEKVASILDSFDLERSYLDINEVIELYNIHLIVSSSRVKPEYFEKYGDITERLMPIVANYFKDINDETFIDKYQELSYMYIDDFWTLFDKFKVYEKVSESTFGEIINNPNTTLYKILEHKAIVSHYDKSLADILRRSEQTGRIITGEFLERKRSNHKKCYFPKSLPPSEFEGILDRYIDSPDAHVGVLQMLSISQSSEECPISDELRRKAKKKAELFWESRGDEAIILECGIGVCFEPSDEVCKVESEGANRWKFIYDVNWIKENLDFPTLFNNFIYLFGYVDKHFRCNFPSVASKLGIIERDFGVKGKKEYSKGAAFDYLDIKSHAEMRGYSEILSQCGIRIEKMIQWFFEEYLKEEFGVSGFVINVPSNETTWLEKCKLFPSEMEGVLKQFTLYVESGDIDRELYEMSSKPLRYEDIPSLHKSKYIYGKSEAIRQEQFLVFSDQSMLHYLHKEKKTYRSFAEALVSRKVSIADYDEWMHAQLFWLKERGVIDIDESSGLINANWSRVMLLKDLYDHEVICPNYYKDKSDIERLVASDDLEVGCSLFSIPEQRYLNYVLNKAEYSNGLDLRNKYSHSSYPLDENRQRYDYIIMLRTMIVIIIKINEEFCIKYPEKRWEAVQ